MTEQINSSAPSVPSNVPTQDAGQVQGQGADINTLLAQLQAQFGNQMPPQMGNAPQTPQNAPQGVPQALGKVDAPPATQDASMALPEALGGFSVKDADPTTQMALLAAQAMAPGIDFKRMVGKALEYGDPNLIDKQYLKEAFPGKDRQLGKVAEQLVQYVSQRADQLQNQVYALVGGEAEWDSAVQAFNSSAPLPVRRMVKAGLDSRDPTRIMEAAQTVQSFAQMAGFASQRSGSPVNPYAPAAPKAQGLSYNEFKNALAKLEQNGGRRDGEWIDNVTLLMKARQVGKAGGR